MPTTRDSTLAETVADALRQALRDGVYLPGERLAELSIAQEMSVSQNTARDALRLLEGEGWIVKLARYGTKVRAFSPEDVLELYDLRAALEGLALKWALDNARPGEINRLRHSVISEAGIRLEIGDASGAREAVAMFHSTLTYLAARPQTIEVLTRLHNQSRLLDNLRAARLPRDSEAWRQVLLAYRSLLEWMEKGDRAAAHAALRDILIEEGRSLAALIDLVR
jgi:DNA-binding GntR family transcriptional regulator